jgi:hypothetical protein
MKITVRKATNNDSKVWFVDYTPPGGKRRRISFETRALAEAHAEGLRSQESQAGEIWLALDARERSEVVSVLAEVKGAGLTLRTVWDRFRKSGPRAGVSKPLGLAFDEFMIEKKAALLSTKAEKALKSNVGRFVQGREAVPVCNVTRQDVLTWLTRPDWTAHV